MKFKLNIEYLGKIENKHEAEKDMYHLTFKTYNAEITGKFERSELRHLIQQLDNAIV
jgi:Ca2+-binding EF-hand superfamily protein